MSHQKLFPAFARVRLGQVRIVPVYSNNQDVLGANASVKQCACQVVDLSIEMRESFAAHTTVACCWPLEF